MSAALAAAAKPATMITLAGDACGAFQIAVIAYRALDRASAALRFLNRLLEIPWCCFL
jgi:hypothetical protein